MYQGFCRIQADESLNRKRKVNMLTTAFFCIAAGGFFNGVYAKKNRIISVMLCVCLFILFVFADNRSGRNGDYSAYSTLYERFLHRETFAQVLSSDSSEYVTDHGFMFLMQICAAVKLPFSGFRLLIAAVSLLLCSKTISMITENNIIVSLMYCIYPFFYDLIQIRYLLGYSAVVYGCRYLLENKSGGAFRFTVCVIAASLIHSSCLYFLIFLLIYLRKAPVLKPLFAVSAVLSILSAFSGFNIASVVFRDGQMSKYDDIGYKLNIFTSAAMILYIAFFISAVHRLKSDEKYYDILRWINYICILLIPFMFVSLDFERFMRPVLIMDYAYIAGASESAKLNKRIIILAASVFVLSCRCFLMSGFAVRAFTDNTIFGLGI